MSSVRVYVPCTITLLRGIVTADGLGPPPFTAHAVTDALRAAYVDGAEEEWEYVVSAAAAQTALELLLESDPPRRVVVAVDVATVRPLDDEDPTLVQVDEPVPLRRVAAVLVDDEDAAADVRAAVAGLAAAQGGDPQAVAVVERCLDHELGWYATQEIGALLDA
jgi:hypothetical protein